jgi:hypothetical protein
LEARLNSKERVYATLNGQIPDRVPIGESAIDFDTVEKIVGHETYLRAKGKSKIAFWEGRHDEVAESYLRDHIELHQKLDLDIVVIEADASWEIPARTDDIPPRRIDAKTWEDKYGRVYKYSDVTADITCVYDPVAEARQFTADEYDIEPELLVPDEPFWRAAEGWCGDCDRSSMVQVLDERSWKILDGITQRFKGEKFIIGPAGGEIGMVLLGGMRRGFIELMDHPEAVRAATTLLLGLQNLHDETMIHPDCDAIWWGLDFGYKTGPFISPSMFKEFFLDPNKERARHIREKHAKKIIKHCCGNVNSLLDFFVEIGYDCYQSIQASADMDLCELKQSHGDRIALWGGVSVEHIVSGSPEEVRQDVRRAMECAKPGGRFILGTSHSVAVGSNYDNYMAMLDEYHKLCDY